MGITMIVCYLIPLLVSAVVGILYALNNKKKYGHHFVVGYAVLWTAATFFPFANIWLAFLGTGEFLREHVNFDFGAWLFESLSKKV